MSNTDCSIENSVKINSIKTDKAIGSLANDDWYVLPLSVFPCLSTCRNRVAVYMRKGRVSIKFM